MRVRSNRTHYMGVSNRTQNLNKNKSNSILQRSFNKSLMLSQKNKSTFIETTNKSQNLIKAANYQLLKKSQTLRQNPFNGTNNQLQSLRFDKMNIRMPSQKHQQIKILPKLIDKSNLLNQKVKNIKQQFRNCNVSMHKLFLIKQTFIKNNRDRLNLKQYFSKFANNQGIIGKKQLKNLISHHGYDINDDQIRLIFTLNNAQLNNSKDKQQLNMPQFINLMTKQNVYFKTLNIQHHQRHTKKFIDRHFQILRNKFAKLKQAFKIYKQRGEKIDYQRFNYTMKKLDITDLIMPKKQRDELFHNYFDSTTQQFNPDKLLSAIAIQNYSQSKNKSQKNQFEQNLKYIQQLEHQNMQRKIQKFDLKRSSNLEYQNHKQKISQMLQKIRQISKQKDIINQICNKPQENVEIKELKNNIQKILQAQGYNFSKDHYDSFISYFDFDKDNKIDKINLQKFLLKQTYKQAEDRFQRRVRNIRPVNHTFNHQFVDQNQALKSLQLFKNMKMNPQTNNLYKKFDLDKDGYVCREQFKRQIKKIINQQAQAENLLNYFFQDHSSLNREQFTEKFNKQLVQIQPARTKSFSQWIHLKRSVISQNNNFKYQNPTKFSAWPSYLNQSNLSLIQPPKNAGIYLNQKDRFNVSQKHDYGQRQKLEKAKIQNKRIAKIAAWNNRYQNQLKQKILAEEKKQLQKNYGVRVTRELYLQNLKEDQ